MGTKLDDVENRNVSTEAAQEICRQFNITSYFETSSSTGENVDEAFFSVASRAYQMAQAAGLNNEGSPRKKNRFHRRHD